MPLVQEFLLKTLAASLKDGITAEFRCVGDKASRYMRGHRMFCLKKLLYLFLLVRDCCKVVFALPPSNSSFLVAILVTEKCHHRLSREH